jgi:predicted phosphoribosyltransferase
MKTFRDRAEAGRRVAARIARLDLVGDVVVLGLPRGGVPVAYEVATALDAPLDVLLVRKLGAPFNPELAVGAIAYGGVTVYNDSLLESLGLDEADLETTRHRENEELQRRERAYRGDRPPLDVRGKTVILVDDGMATGATMHAAVTAIRKLAPAGIIVAVPTSSRDSYARIEAVADRVIALETPEPYYGVGAWYVDFSQIGDEEVVAALHGAAARRSARSAGNASTSQGEPRARASQ